MVVKFDTAYLGLLIHNRRLHHLVLHDNPLGAAGARKLLRSVHSGESCVID